MSERERERKEASEFTPPSRSGSACIPFPRRPVASPRSVLHATTITTTKVLL